MDFSKIKNLVIPEGNVIMISHSGLVLWKKRIPSTTYTELDYLESTGTQWIDIGTTVDTSTDEIELCFQLTETGMYKWFFGEYDTNARLGLGSGDGINKRNFLYKSSTAKISDTDVYNRQHKYLINASGGFIDGVKKVGYDSFSSNSTLYLFNINIDGSSDYKCKAKVWTYKQTRNGVLIRDLIPVLDKNNIPCMYDKVSGEFFYNKGTGEFLYGLKPNETDADNELITADGLKFLTADGNKFLVKEN